MIISDLYSNSNNQNNPNVRTLYNMDIYSQNSNTDNRLRADESSTVWLETGDILEGVVESVGKSTTVSFSQLNNREFSFDSKAVNNAYVGEKRRFEVVEASSEKLVLRDLGGIGAEIEAKGILSTRVDLGMPKLVEGFEDTLGEYDENEDDTIKKLSDDDYKELTEEGFSIEKYKAERLVRALDRIKTNRAAKAESIENQSEKIKKTKENIRKQSASAVADKYAAHRNIVEALENADLPVTDENVSGIITAITMSNEAVKMTDNSMAYIIGNGLEPTIENVYRSVYSGSIRRSSITPEDWKGIALAAGSIIEDAKKLADNSASENGIKLETVTEEDARWFVEYDLSLTGDNLVYKKELEELKKNGRNEEEIIDASVRALDKSEPAQSGMLISSYEPGNRQRDSFFGGNGKGSSEHEAERGDRYSAPIEELTFRLRLQEIRLSMSTEGGITAKVNGLEIDVAELNNEITSLKAEIKAYYEALAVEVGIGAEEVNNAVDMAVKTGEAVEDIAAAPVTLYGVTYSERNTLTLDGLAQKAFELRIAEQTESSASAGDINASLAIRSYEAAATEVRRDLGDSISKAFGNIDELLKNINFELTEANRRAVKILGHNSMEITAENIEAIKYYDAKITSMIDGLKPVMVMSMIKQGFNPLEQDIDTINDKISEIEQLEGRTPEESFSSFLVRLEESNAVSEQARAAYVGVYRLLYQIEKSDGAAIGATIASGRRMTLKNLLTEARSAQNRGLDRAVDDDTDIANTVYSNSITDQILEGFTGQVREQIDYNMQLVREALRETSPLVWDEALGDEEIEELTPEQVVEKLQNADKYSIENDASAAARIRSVMTAGGASKRFLRSLGVDDSTDNIETLNNAGDELSLPFASGEELLEKLTDSQTLRASFSEAENKLLEATEQEFLGNIAILTKGLEIDAQLKRYGLLKEMADKEHFRMNIEGEKPAKINLTLVHSTENAGTISLEVSTLSYRVRADISITVYNGEDAVREGLEGKLDGRVSCDSQAELDAIKAPLEAFAEAMKAEGYDASGIIANIDRINTDMYLSRLGELKRKAAYENAAVESNERKKASTMQLYSIAKQFLAKFI